MKKVILAIDDNEDFIETLKDMLGDEGYKVVGLTDPTKTEEFIEKHKPHLLMIDVFMPKKTGFNLLEDFNAKKKYEDIPKIFLTCLDDDIEKMTARACGVMYYVTKPFKPEELLDTVKKALRGKRKGGADATR